MSVRVIHASVGCTPTGTEDDEENKLVIWPIVSLACLKAWIPTTVHCLPNKEVWVSHQETAATGNKAVGKEYASRCGLLA